MATTVTLNSVNYTIPAPLDRNWGLSLSNYLIALSTGVLSKAGGSFTLTADANFGADFGLRAVYFRSRDTAASVGTFRLASSESIAWRNSANDGDNVLSIDSVTEGLLYNGTPILALSLGSANTALKMNSGATAYEWGLLGNANIASDAAITYSKLNLTSSIVNADVSASAAIAYSKLNLAGSIVNADVSASAAIAYSKLSLSDSIVNADISASAAIDYSKLNLAGEIVDADIATEAGIAYSKLDLAGEIVDADIAPDAAITFSKVAAPGAAKGDLIVFDGSSHTRLAVGPNGRVLTADSSQSTGLAWVDPSSTSIGQVPVGAIIPIASNLTGAHIIPESGEVDASGWMYCDGSEIPEGQTLEGTLPDLTGDIFLMGSTSSGTTGGTNENATTSGGSITFNKNILNTNQNSHTHAGTATVDGSTLRAMINLGVNGTDLRTEYARYVSSTTWNASHGSANIGVSEASPPTTQHGAQLLGMTGTSISTWESNVVTFGTTAGTTYSSPVVDDNRPNYITVQYLIRVS